MGAINHIIYIIRNDDVHLKQPRNRIAISRFFFHLKSFLCKEKRYWTPACDRLLLKLHFAFPLSFYHTSAYCHNTTFQLQLSFPLLNSNLSISNTTENSMYIPNQVHLLLFRFNLVILRIITACLTQPLMLIGKNKVGKKTITNLIFVSFS